MTFASWETNRALSGTRDGPYPAAIVKTVIALTVSASFRSSY